jgi:hypothetical protein
MSLNIIVYTQTSFLSRVYPVFTDRKSRPQKGIQTSAPAEDSISDKKSASGSTRVRNVDILWGRGLQG